MAANKKAAPLATGTDSNTVFDQRNCNPCDPLQGWFDLAKPSRNRQQKKTRKKGARR